VVVSLVAQAVPARRAATARVRVFFMATKLRVYY